MMGWRQSIRAVLEEYRTVTGATKADQAVELIFFIFACGILGCCAAAAIIMGGANA